LSREEDDVARNEEELERNQRLIQLKRRPRSQEARAAVHADALAERLRRATDAEVQFDAGARALYSTDSSNYRQAPIGVVLPRSKRDVIETIAACRDHGAPILARGGGTSLAGQTCNFAVVIDMSKYLREVLDVDPHTRLARVQPGVILDDLRHQAERHDLTFGPDPATHNHNCLGGMLGNNSCGPHSVMAGRTADNVRELEIATYDGLVLRVGATSPAELAAIIAAGGRRGDIYRRLQLLRDRYAELIRARYPRIPRRVSGYNLDELLPENGFHVARALVGSEGTCVTILEATLELIPWPRARSVVLLGFDDLFHAADAVPEVMAQRPTACEGLDDKLIGYIHKKGLHEKYLRYLPDGRSFLLVEVGGDSKAEADDKARRLMAAVAAGEVKPRGMKLYDDDDQERAVWKIRESGLGDTARVPGEPDTWPGWEDSAVAPERLGEYLRQLRALFNTHGYDPSLYGHFGQGLVHCRVSFDLQTAAGLQSFRAFMNEAADLCVRFGGSLSGEHGDGQARAELLPKMFGPELVRAFGEFKAIWDPDGKMNPGKVVAPYAIDENLRLGLDYDPPRAATHFQFPDDEGDFTRATLRCVGVGKCRRTDGGTMCPSFMVTHEEKHTTRGRAHLLFEMMRGRELHGWRDENVKESLDLCLACKGCKGDCPINVDMATYKAEFLAHYYKGRVRPIAAYSMGLIYWWARLASHAPGLANFVSQTPGLAALFKRLGGIAPERRVPRFAARTFKQWWKRRPARNLDRPRVLLWADTFNNHFFPETAMAAVEVLEAAGFHVVVPTAPLCCGRPLYDFGMLPTAKRLARQVLAALKDDIEAGVPLVGLEPSCVSVFRDELVNLFPHDQDAQRLKKQTYLFGELLREHAPDFAYPRLERRATVHGHCHHKSLFGMDDEKHVLDRLGLAAEIVDSGCCGMAGSFGFERGEKYDVSVKAGERKLLPAVRGADEGALIIADGFSCREQIAQGTSRRALHVAEVVQLALHTGPGGPPGRPERSWPRPSGEPARLAPWKPALASALAGAGAGLLAARGARRWTVAAAVTTAVAMGLATIAAHRQRRRAGKVA
jgi:FAD/FMN-containing dehydrogenase/Fe-S oxidoreductase